MNASKLSPDDPRLTAYALGELQGDERAAIEAALADDPLARAYVEETRRFAAHLQSALVDEPLPAPAETGPAPASRLHLLPPYEPKGPKLLQFPQLYFVAGGLAAACFAVMVALRENQPHGAPQAKQYVAVNLDQVGAAPEGSAVAEAGGEGNEAVVASSLEENATSSDTTAAVLTPPSRDTVAMAANVGTPPSPMSVEPPATSTARSNATVSAENAGRVVADGAPASEAAAGNETRKRVVTIVAKKKRSTAAAAPSTNAVSATPTPPVLPLPVERPAIAAVAPLPLPPPKDMAPGGQFVSAAKAPVTRFTAPVDTGSFAAIKAAVLADKLPDPQLVEIEELLNHAAGDSSGSAAKVAPGAVAASGEVGPAPWSPTHRLVRVTVLAGASPAGAAPALAARDVSMAVEFNPRRVYAYRLIGYERTENASRHPITSSFPTADFRANRAVVALFEVIPSVVAPPDPEDPTYSARHLVTEEAPRPRPEMVTVHVQYRHAVTGARTKVRAAVEDTGATFVATSDDFKYFAGVAAYGMILRHSSYRGRATLGDAIAWAEAGLGGGRATPEREEMLDLMRRTRAVMQARHG